MQRLMKKIADLQHDQRALDQGYIALMAEKRNCLMRR